MPKEKTLEVNRIELMLAYLCIKDLSSLPEQVEVLDHCGFASAEIAAICGVAEGSVRNARMQIKKGKSKGRPQLPRTKEK